jgi:HK97 family phage portal protein
MNGDIRGAIHLISGAVAKNGIYLQDNKRQTVEDNVLTDEVAYLFQSPTFEKFKLSLFRNYFVSGELYIVPVQNLQGENVRLQVLDSRSITKTIVNGKIINFRYNNGTESKVFQPDEIAFFKFEEDIRESNNGMSLLTGVVYDGLSDLEAMKTNYSFYQNSAIPSAILLLDGDLSYEEQQNAKEIFDAQFKGSENQHKTLLAGGIKDVKNLSISNRDMEFINQRHLTTEKICALFRTPKALLGYTDGVNYSTAESQAKDFIEGAVTTYTNELEHIMNKCISMFFPKLFKTYWIKCDSMQVQKKEEEFESQRKDVMNGIRTINEIRIERGLEPVTDENADKLLMNKNVSLLEDISLDPSLNIEE